MEIDKLNDGGVILLDMRFGYIGEQTDLGEGFGGKVYECTHM